MPESEWKLGKDLLTFDCVFDPITFDDLILPLQCNYRKEDINRAAVLEVFKEIMDIRAQDTSEILSRNIDEIIAYAKGEGYDTRPSCWY